MEERKQHADSKHLGMWGRRKGQKTCTLKTIRHLWKKSMMTQTDGTINHDLKLEASILSKWPCYSRQYKDSMQSLSNYQWLFFFFFYKTRKNYFKVYLEAWMNLKSQSNPEKEKWSWRNQAPCLQAIMLQDLQTGRQDTEAFLPGSSVYSCWHWLSGFICKGWVLNVGGALSYIPSIICFFYTLVSLSPL